MKIDHWCFSATFTVSRVPAKQESIFHYYLSFYQHVITSVYKNFHTIRKTPLIYPDFAIGIVAKRRKP